MQSVSTGTYPSFRPFVITNARFIYLSLVVSIVYFIVLRNLYPIPSFFSDSYTYVGGAARNQPVTFRPIMYSKFIQFFKLLSPSDLALIAAQYFSSVLANLLLFYSFSWLFNLKRFYQWLLFVLVIVHPFYLFSANYISSDAFFNNLTVIWFTLLLWIIHRPRWWIIILHVVLLGILFMLRYNAIYFPALTAIAVIFTNAKLWKKMTIVALVIAVIAGCIIGTKQITKSYIGVDVFSGFSGWQLANNALHIVRFTPIDTTQIADAEVKQLLQFSQAYFDTTHEVISTNASSWYMWHPNSPLKLYMHSHNPRTGYFTAWNRISPVYSKFGKTIIIQHPAAYWKRFVKLNSKPYLYPPLEIYESYFEGRDTIAKIATEYFHYKSNKAPAFHPVIQRAVFGHIPALFFLMHIILVCGGIGYIAGKRFRRHAKLLNRSLFIFSIILVANCVFVVLLAPSVLRYHIFIFTLSFPVVLFLIQDFLSSEPRHHHQLFHGSLSNSQAH